MENKYYDLIGRLIKNHKKYETYSSIFEELVSHVYEQARTIINTIEDETVIENYLNKIIASAFITVPKKMNCCVSHRQNLSDSIIAQATQLREEQELQRQEITSTIEEVAEPATFDEEADDLEALTEEVLIQENPLEIDPAENSDFDKSLIDKMINGISSDNTSTETDETTEDSVAELYDSLEELDTTTEENFNESIIEQKDNTDSDIIELDLDAKDDLLETNVDNIIIQEETIENTLTEVIEKTEENFLNIDEESLDTDTFVETEVAELEEESFELEDEVLEADTLVEAEVAELEEESFELEDEVLEADTLVEAEVTELEEEPFELEENILEADTLSEPLDDKSCYNFFKFEPVTKYFDSDEILSDLSNLDQKYPNKLIIEIVKLKYNEKLSLDEISERTGLGIDEVIETLNEVIDIVKD